MYDVTTATCFETKADQQVREDHVGEDHVGEDHVREDHVREDKGYYFTDFLFDNMDNTDSRVHIAAEDHAKHLRKAEHSLDEALNLIGLMLASIGDEGDSRAMQTETGLKLIEKTLSRARRRIDRHGTRHTQLFLEYFELKGKEEGIEQD